MKVLDFYIQSKTDIIEAVERFGFLPLFSNSIQGFSIEEHVSPRVWFGTEDGVWEWKGPVIREAGCAYGKFFENKAAFISRKWFAHFANYRRDGYDFDAKFEDGLASFRDLELFNLINDNTPALSKDLKKKGNYGKSGKKGFETIITRLQHQGYILISDFVYETDRSGNPYGWGVAEYSTPEKMWSMGFRDEAYSVEPEESYELLVEHFRNILPEISDEKIRRFLK